MSPVKRWTVDCPCGATSGPLTLNAAMRWASCHRCEEVQGS